jgi:hypothetical protein
VFPNNSVSNNKYQNEFKDLTKLQARSLDCMVIPYPNAETKTILYEIRVGETASAPMEGYTNQFDLSCNMEIKPGFYNIQESNSSPISQRIEVR